MGGVFSAFQWGHRKGYYMWIKLNGMVGVGAGVIFVIYIYTFPSLFALLEAFIVTIYLLNSN